MIHRTCKDCGRCAPESEYRYQGARGPRFRTQCKPCFRIANAAAMAAHKARKRGVTLEYVAPSAMVAGTPHEQAQAVCSAEGTVDVFRFASGAITWRRKGGNVPNAEFVGRYNEGADYRRVVEDLREAA